MKKTVLFFLLLSFSVYSGCATIFSGSSSEIDLSSEPQGAKVLVNGSNEGTTPLKLKLQKGKEYVIEFVKDGFKNKSLRMSYGLGAGWLILDILCGLVGIIVDAASGNWNEFDLSTYKANLEAEK
ncbi:MAG: PEGA domain-containing protein [Bacteroidetes bacterium]|nr:PEGA domain-containing protein [Bacteroidota bacterium]MBX7047006.1 PEGA domain-containing protein [Ignavibacteria bacterium]